ncbi:serpin family protein [uncultured Neglectibacter sp.]|uniref:serpin family protein n=1 Tax=uncultured Neglectibacter sp. TaxID=1924108 RepID=UPI0034DFD6F9
MKTPEEFRNDVYEKHSAQLVVRRRRKKQALLCIPLALLIVLGSVFIPRAIQNGVVPIARTGRIPRIAQVGNPVNPVDIGLFDHQSSPEEKLVKIQSDYQKRGADNGGSAPEVTEELVRELTGETKIDPEFSYSINQFAKNSSVLLQEEFGENGCYSPLSLYYAMALTGRGAGGKTKDEFESILYADDVWAAEQCGKFYRQHYHDGEDSSFWLANSLWLDGRYSFGDDFIKTAEEDFYSSLFQADFSDPTLSGDMKKWVSDHTNGLLQPEFEFQKDQMLTILNAVYYKAQWQNQFQESATAPGDFYKADGSTVTADFMHCSTNMGEVRRGNGFISASLRLKNSDEMVFVLPDEEISAQELLSDPVLFEDMFLNENVPVESGMIHWSVPKFSFDCEYDLQNTLKGLGLDRAFDEVLADFSDMGRLEMYLSETKQGVHIGIDENGVEAAAYTEFGAEATGAAPENVFEMDLNRPFLFAIRSHDLTVSDDTSTQTLLFVGVCGDPTASGSGSAAAAG